MYPNQRAQAHQHTQIKKAAANSDSYAFFNLLTAPALLDTVEALAPDQRERIFPPTETLSMFIAQALAPDRSCQKAVDDASVKRLIGGLPPCSTHTGAYCKARQRLPLTMISTLACHIGTLMTEHTPIDWRWQGRPVRLVDGAGNPGRYAC